MAFMKFSKPIDIEVFKLLQQHGILSLRKLAKLGRFSVKAGMAALKRLQSKGIYRAQAIPRLERFEELPLACLAINNAYPHVVQNIKESFIQKEEVRAFFTNDQHIWLLLMHTSKFALSEIIKEISDHVGNDAKIEVIPILSPRIEKFDMTIPDTILDTFYDFGEK